MALLLATVCSAPCAEISGRVVNSVTGAPVARVSLTLSPARVGSDVSNAFTSTAPDGTFSFVELKAGVYVLRGDRNGFLSIAYGANSPQTNGAPLYVEEGQSLNIVFRLIPQSVLAVKVFDEHGEPLNGASVQVLRRLFVAGRRRTVPVASGRTNDLGDYRAPNLSAGTYYAAATPPPSSRPVAERVQGQAGDSAPGPTYFPAATDFSNATAIKLGAGQETAASVTIARSFTYRIHGDLPESLADPEIAAALVLSPRDAAPVAGSGTNPAGRIAKDGSFEMTGVLPGSYVLGLMGARDGGRARVLARTDVTVLDRDVEGLVLTPVTSVLLKGRVRIEDEEKANFKGLRIDIAPLDNLPGASEITSVAVAPDGTFAIEDLTQSRYQLRPRAIAGAYLKQVRWGDEDASGKAIDLLNIATPPALEFVFSRKPVRLEVIVDRPLEKDAGTVLIVPDPYRPTELPFPLRGEVVLVPDQGGLAVADDLPPGSYRVYAFEHFDPNEALDPALLESQQARSERMSLSAGQAGRVAVKPIAAQELN